MMLPLRALIIGAALLAGCTCLHVPPVDAACIGTTCGSSLTTYLDMCRLNQSCNRTDFIDNMNNNWITLDTKFAPTVGLEGHGHRGTDGDGPKLSPGSAFNCIDSPADGETAVYDSTTGTCEWVPNAGGGGGDITGPGSSTDNAIVCFDGTLGDTIKECGTDWLVNASNNLISATGSIGIGDLTPNARLEVEETSPGIIATLSTCSGATTVGGPCSKVENTQTSSTASTINVGHTVAVAGSNSGLGAQNIGTLYLVTGGTSNQAIYVNNGDIVVADGQYANGSDVVPDADLDILQSNNAEPAILVTGTSMDATTMQINATGVATGPHQAMVIANTKTGASTGEIKSGLQITSGGAWNGQNVALLINATDGAEANYAVAALTGDIAAIEGTVSGSTTDATTAGDFTCSGNPGQCLRVTNTGVSANDAMHVSATGTNPFGLDLEVTGDGTGSATGFEMDVTNTNANVAAFQITTSGQEGNVISLIGNAESDTVSMIGQTITMDGNTTSGIVVGQVITVSDGTVPQAIQANCTQTVGADTAGCIEVTVTGDGSGSFYGITADVATGGGSAGAVALDTSTTGTTTSASTGASIANSTTSSTASINKTGLDVTSTGTWNGSGAINAAVRGSATGGTENHAFWALQGGFRGPYMVFDPTATEPVACASGTEGWVAYDSDINLLCICSDSDGGSFEWEAIVNAATACFT